jgi:hypothetical protein
MIKQTAVQWLIDELKLNDTIEKENLIIARQILEQAKAMEKKQIIEAHQVSQLFSMMTSEQYYNEIYGDNK